MTKYTNRNFILWPEYFFPSLSLSRLNSVHFIDVSVIDDCGLTLHKIAIHNFTAIIQTEMCSLNDKSLRVVFVCCHIYIISLSAADMNKHGEIWLLFAIDDVPLTWDLLFEIQKR